MLPPAVPQLNIRYISIIDSFPVYKVGRTVLDVGCGTGKLGYHLAELGYQVYGVDAHHYDLWDVNVSEDLNFSVGDIFDLNTFPIPSVEIVMCGEVLEHLPDWRTALMNLLELTEVRLIVTVPFEKSYNCRGHKNYWNDTGSDGFMDINEFRQLAAPYCTSITKIRSKPKDVRMKQLDYLIIIDKRQQWM